MKTLRQRGWPPRRTLSPEGAPGELSDIRRTSQSFQRSRTECQTRASAGDAAQNPQTEMPQRKNCKDQQNDVTLESMHVPRASPPALPRQTGSTQSDRRSRLDVPPHGALGGFALTAATLVASTPTSSSGVGRLGDGGRGASKR